MATGQIGLSLGDKFRAELNRVFASVPKSTFNVADTIIERIKTRTKSGRSSHDIKFDDYTPRYARQKGTIVNLTGRSDGIISRRGKERMLDQFFVATGEGVRYNVSAERFIPESGQGGQFIKFEDTVLVIRLPDGQVKKQARAHEMGYSPLKIPARPFMGLAPSEEEVVENVFNNSLYRPTNTREEYDVTLKMEFNVFRK